MRILALDLGSQTGWCLLSSTGLTSGSWTLATLKELRAQKLAGLTECCDVRPARLQEKIAACEPLDVVAYESVLFLSSRQQATLWGAFKCIITLMHPRVRIIPVPIQTIKKHGAGKGNATKEEMMAAVRPPKPGLTDDEADAIHLMSYVRKQLGI